MRKSGSYKRQKPNPDFQFGRIDTVRFINHLMKGGEKTTAERLFYDALSEIGKTAKTNEPIKIFEKAIEQASPMLEVVSKRVGGANYQVPNEVRPERRFFLACKWIIDAARKKKGKAMAIKLAEELLAASKNEGIAIKKKQDMHRMAEANRAFASFVKRKIAQS